LGASPNPDRYAHKAILALLKHRHEVVPVNPAFPSIEGIPCIPDLSQLPSPVDTVTVYVGPQRIGPLIPSILSARPRRIIMNPGAESEALESAARAAGILCESACTLVLLSTGQF
jgi:predicted CoA-binding protein